MALYETHMVLYWRPDHYSLSFILIGFSYKPYCLNLVILKSSFQAFSKSHNFNAMTSAVAVALISRDPTLLDAPVLQSWWT